MPSEYPLILESAFKNGLKPDDRSPVNAPYLETCQNVRPTAYGLCSPEAITQPISGFTPSISWPFPMLMRLSDITLILDRTAIYEVTESGWTHAQVTTYDLSDLAEGLAITGGGVWHIADFRKVLFLTNGSSLLVKLPTTSWKLAVTTDTDVATLTEHNGRLYLGGVADATQFATTIWGELWNEWKKSASEGTMTYTAYSMNTNVLMWSEPFGGQINEPFALFISLLGYSDANLTKFRELAMKLINEGVIGFLPMEWQGSIKIVKSLGKDLIVYGDNGVTLVSPDHQRVEMLPVGVPGRGCVAGDKRAHVFVDVEGVLWKMKPGGSIERLGYENQIANMTLANITGSYDVQEDEFYFCDGTAGYVLTPTGLGEVTILPTALNRCASGLVGISSNLAVSGATVVTEPFDMGVTDLKNVKSVDVLSRGVTTARAGVDYRHSVRDSFTTGGTVIGSPEGTFFPRKSGIDFRLRLTGVVGAGDKIERATIRYEYASSRSIRGPRGGAVNESV